MEQPRSLVDLTHAANGQQPAAMNALAQALVRAGSVVCFDNLHADGRPDPDSLHAGLPVTAGSKWLGTLWFRQQRYRHW